MLKILESEKMSNKWYNIKMVLDRKYLKQKCNGGYFANPFGNRSVQCLTDVLLTTKAKPVKFDLPATKQLKQRKTYLNFL